MCSTWLILTCEIGNANTDRQPLVCNLLKFHALLMTVYAYKNLKQEYIQLNIIQFDAIFKRFLKKIYVGAYKWSNKACQ